MAGKRFTPVTGLLVGFVVYGVYLIGHSVNPPPPGPPKPVAQPTLSASQIASYEKQKGEMVKHEKVSVQKVTIAKAKPVFNPTSVDVTPTYWSNTDMGEQGVKETDKKVAEALAAQKTAVHQIVKKDAAQK